MCVHMHKYKDSGIPVKYVRCGDAGQNKQPEKRADNSDWKLGIEFQYTARDTMQHNHLAEIGFATLSNSGRDLIHASNLLIKLRYNFKRIF